jgi:hypothetical protein
MFENEERRGLVFTLVGGGLLVAAVLVWIGFFTEPSAPATVPTADAAARPPSSPLKLGAARGRVIDARSGFGLAASDVEVRGLEGISDHWLLEPDPAAPGVFEVRGLPAGRRCSVALSAEGYVAAIRPLDVVAGATAELGDVALVPLVTLVGQLVDASGIGIGDARVELEAGDGTLVTADGDLHGSFRCERLAPGVYSLRGRSDAGDESFADLRVDASAGGEQRGLQVELFPTVALRGTFRLPVGSSALAGVQAQGARGRVGGDGRFEIDGLKPGPVRLVALVDAARGVALDAVAPAEGLDLVVDLAAALPLSQLRDPGPEDLAALLAAPMDESESTHAALVVRALDGEGRRLAGARIDLSGGDAPMRRVRFTSRSGECVVRGLRAPLAWSVSARHGSLEATTTATLEADSTRELVLTLAPPPPPPGAAAPAAQDGRR